MVSSPQINEFMFNPSVSGDPDEFIEIQGDASTDYSAWSLIVVDGDGSVAGKVDNVFQLGTTSPSGYWATPFVTNTLQNGTQTVLLVKDFTGKVGDDLDVGNTGSFTSTPWSEIGNTLAVTDGDKGDITYNASVVLSGALAAGASRISATATTGSSNWVADDPALSGLPGYSSTPASGTVLLTPGAANDTSSAGGGSDTGSGDDTGGSSGSGGSTGSGGDTGSGDTGTVKDVTIQQINGTGYYSTLAGSTVMTTGVVTAVDTNGSIGFWIQEADKDESTVGSSGIFVYAGTGATLPTVGTTVSVTGKVTNYSGTSWSNALALPELNLVSYTATGASYTEVAPILIGKGGLTVPAASYLTDIQSAINLNTSTASLQPDTNALDFYKNLVGQLITINNAVVVDTTASNATWVVPDDGNGLITATGALQETADSLNTQRIEIYYDSGVTPGDAPVADVGDKLGTVTGVLSYYNGVYELVPTTQVTVVHTNITQQTTSFHKDDQNLLVCDYNIENFNALDPANADRLSALVKIILNNLNAPDILALQEIQDDSGTTSDGTVSAEQNIEAIIRAIAAAGGPTYSYAEVDPADGTQGGVSGGNIRSIYLYNADRVSLVSPVTTIGGEDLSTTFKNTRLPLVGTFSFNGKDVTLINVHLSSQAGSSEEYGSVQAPINHGGTTGTVNNRIAQADYISSYVQSLVASDPNAKVGVLGDFNDVEWSAAQQVYTTSGLTDLNTLEDAGNRYTYIFEGNAESLDHTLGTTGLTASSQFETVHVNTGWQNPESDHDPSVTLINMSDYVTDKDETLSGVTIASGQTASANTGASVSDVSIAQGGRLALYSGSTASAVALASGVSIDLPELAWSGNATATLTDPSTLLISNGTDSYTVGLSGDYDAAFFTLQSDGSGGTLIVTEGTPCYCRGTLIRTERGDVPVEHLVIGDRVATCANGYRPVRWIGRRSYSGQFANGNHDILPVIFRKGSLGDGLPVQDLSVSPLHAMYLDGVLVPALVLVNGTGIVQAGKMDEVAYFHIELESHDIIFANGAASESFVDDGSRGMFHNAGEYDALYPDAVSHLAQYCAPRVEEGAKLEAIRRRIHAKSGQIVQATETVGALRGFLDTVTHDFVAGWASGEGDDAPVRLQILDNGLVLGEVTADGSRSDLGRDCGFRFNIPGGLSPLQRHVIEVRRIGDHSRIGNTPWMLDQAEQLVSTAVSAPSPVAPLEGYLDHVGRDRVSGWAWNPASPAEPVTLRIVDNGVVIASIVANARRPDVARTGRSLLCGFNILLPGGLSPLARHVIEIRRESDDALLAEPAVLEAATAFDRDIERAIAGAVEASAGQDSQTQVLSFLLGQVEKLRQSSARAESGAERRELMRARRLLGHVTEPAASRQRVLVIDSRRPDAMRDAGSRAVLSHMEAFLALGFDVSFVAADQPDGPAVLKDCPEARVLGLPVHVSVEDILRRQANSFDVVYLHREDVATRYLALVRRYQTSARVLYNVADLHFLRLARQAAIQSRPELLAQAGIVKTAEYRAALQADAVLTHSAEEMEILRRELPQANAHFVPWAVPVQRAVTGERAGVLFLGNYTHAPNVDAARWLVEDIMPLVWKRDASIRCVLAGADMPDSVAALAETGVEIAGRTDDLNALFGRVSLSVAPLRFGAGIKGKVLDSLAAGVPCVMTPVAAEGLALPEALAGLVHADPEALAEEIVRLHRRGAMYDGLSRAGQSYIRAQYSNDVVRELLREVCGGKIAKMLDVG
ncbi:Hint domain-containing protein [Acetobacter fallax]|uniref:Glycosyltransferase n=1 Tax=Acetobacter fallax TaxID=1737473 RepID=A0ABX0K5V8_9PROT|nr:Hint domain-containing protein [Acetobacter fallax]NHO31764.1 glycosyltransferase [Acetobacter fallax]NHO35323.1 glycosyltransferase [Acetobacter fallax]